MHDTPSLFDKPGMSVKTRALRVVSNAVIGRGLRGGGKTIVTSEFLREDCRRVFGVEAEIARMGGLGEAGAFKVRRVEGELRLLSVSRIEGNKRIDWMLRALAAMDREGLSGRVTWRLDVVGRGAQMEAMQSLAEELGVEGRVRFHGYVSDEALEQMYGEAHLFLMPAVQGYGIPAVEALTRGLPVLLHRESGCERYSVGDAVGYGDGWGRGRDAAGAAGGDHECDGGAAGGGRAAGVADGR